MPQRPATVRLSAAGFSPWIPLNRMSSAFGVGLGVKLSSGASLTYSVQHTFDDIYKKTEQFSGARVTTTITITETLHGLSVGDWFKLIGNGAAPFNGEYTVAAITDANNFTATVADAGATALGSGSGSWLQKARVFSHETLAALTASADGNYQFPPKACRLVISSYSSGFAELTVIPGGK